MNQVQIHQISIFLIILTLELLLDLAKTQVDLADI